MDRDDPGHTLRIDAAVVAQRPARREAGAVSKYPGNGRWVLVELTDADARPDELQAGPAMRWVWVADTRDING